MEKYNDIEIIFETEDNAETIARKTFDIHVGTNELKPKLARLGITYTKDVKGLNTFYYLKGRGLDKTLKIKL